MRNEELVLLYQQGDKQALNSLIENNRRIVFKIANKFYVNNTNSIDIEDLEQEGYIGLIIAAEKYNSDMDHHALFITYAIYWVYQKINTFIKQRNTNNEISLNTPLKENEEIERQDLLESIDNGYENTDEKLYLKQLREDLESIMLENITLREREVLKLHYGWECKKCSFTYIGSLFGVSDSRVQQIEHMALRKIRQTKWAKLEYKKHYKSIKHNYNTVENKIDFADKYFKGVI
ncbi:sigma-70 family RNA polymerase sigma factor [Clostridium botulinum]|uniref:sigma-70 family RNA polymerase sigma factor n=1 Tax=Clostridium botulinum TaxID=1491 RepID=UPI0007730899|nr:sigma-70 family RNA polymerase sigma factor [Clostridium botulinum]MBY6931871.1 sigma-70 family RNA polymerase sigma factor [Clostridium botulinum]NFG20563.1 sigma-70 family RNA polymerase sigma factor [Clostridium botulinum]NFO81121.1 sigma-70 family RNA polymerase sigma factor [Clostridium botulinum]